MARVCDLTGKKRMVGNNVSHSLNRTKRTFDTNLIKKRFYIPEDDKWITLKITASALKTINKIGIGKKSCCIITIKIKKTYKGYKNG